MTSMPENLTVQYVSERSGYSTSALYRYMEQGLIQYVQATPGSRKLIPRAEYERLMTPVSRVKPTAADGPVPDLCIRSASAPLDHDA